MSLCASLKHHMFLIIFLASMMLFNITYLQNELKRIIDNDYEMHSSAKHKHEKSEVRSEGLPKKKETHKEKVTFLKE